MTPEFIARMHPEPGTARRLAFALMCGVVAEARGWIPCHLSNLVTADIQPDRLGATLALTLETVALRAPALVGRDILDAISVAKRHAIDERACGDYITWVRAQHLEQEAPLVAYELGVLALGMELPGVMLRSLREVRLDADTTVCETPDGGGYATAFLSSMHPHWGKHAVLCASTDDGERLSTWALVLLLGGFTIEPGRVIRMASILDIRDLPPSDLLLIYNPTSWLGDPRAIRDAFGSTWAILV